jgi:hypothetical protein
LFGSKRDRERLAGARADVDSLSARLASDVSNLDPGEDLVCRQALSDASERASSAGALLSRASTLAEFDVAKRMVLEGLTGTRLIRERLGLPLGPDLPVDPRTVAAPRSVPVDGDLHTAPPSYHPDQPHFFGGRPGLVPQPGTTGPRSGKRRWRWAAPPLGWRPREA